MEKPINKERIQISNPAAVLIKYTVMANVRHPNQRKGLLKPNLSDKVGTIRLATRNPVRSIAEINPVVEAAIPRETRIVGNQLRIPVWVPRTQNVNIVRSHTRLFFILFTEKEKVFLATLLSVIHPCSALSIRCFAKAHQRTAIGEKTIP
jgi:hypothetical protein